MISAWRKRFHQFLASQAGLARGVFDGENHFASAREKFFLVLPYWIAAALTALGAILYARLFQWFELRAVDLYQYFGLWSLLLAPILFLFSWWTVETWSPYANGSGIPQLMAAAEFAEKNPRTKIVNALLGFRVILVKVLSSLSVVLGGGAIGREGPTLQIAGSIFDLTSRFLPSKLKMQNRQGMILAGGAAGLAAAFNTPLGGIAYVIEELSKSHLSFFRTGILHAVIMAGLISQVVMGSYLYFGFPKVDNFSFQQIGIIVLIALSSGLAGSLFGQFLKYIFSLRLQLSKKSTRAFVAAFCGFSIAFFIMLISPRTMGSGRELIEQLLFQNEKASWLDFWVRFFGTSITYATGGAGGIFAPTLAIGGVVGSLTESLFFYTQSPLAVLAGMTAALAALTQSPLTSFILILEMTDRHSAILPLMIAAVIGQGISKLISRESFYEFVAHKLINALRDKEPPPQA